MAGRAFNEDHGVAAFAFVHGPCNPRIDPRRAVMAIDDDVVIYNPFPGRRQGHCRAEGRRNHRVGSRDRADLDIEAGAFDGFEYL